MGRAKGAARYVARASHGTGWIYRAPARLTKALEAKGITSKASVFFADSAHGGKAKARAAAVAYRDEEFKSAGLKVQALGAVRAPDAAGSITGLCGVVPGYRTSPATGAKYVGRWYALQGADKMSFPVRKLGMKEAFWAALQERQRVTGVRFTLSEIKAAMRIVQALPGGSSADQ